MADPSDESHRLGESAPLLTDRRTRPRRQGDFALAGNLDRLRKLWRKVGREITADFIREHPGQRPCAWWVCAAPEPRRRLGGIGTEAYEVLAVVPRFAFGLPMDWVSKFQEHYYNGKAKDIHGAPIGTEYQEGAFDGVAPDPTDRPQFESQGMYLNRLGLLTATEKAWLAQHPEALTPEVLTCGGEEETQ